MRAEREQVVRPAGGGGACSQTICSIRRVRSDLPVAGHVDRLGGEEAGPSPVEERSEVGEGRRRRLAQPGESRDVARVAAREPVPSASDACAVVSAAQIGLSSTSAMGRKT